MRQETMYATRLIAPLLVLCTALAAAEKPMTLDDLGMKQLPGADAALQSDLQKRSTMLQWHQWLGIAALVPMVGSYILGAGSPLDEQTRSLHSAMGISTAALYFSSASFAIFAPKPDGVKDTGSTRWHRYLSYVHFPLMIAVPILGSMARSQAENGEKLHGAASLHGPAASLLLGTYVVAISVLVFNF